MATPNKFSEQVAAKIKEILLEGNYRATAAMLVGISEETFAKWMSYRKEPYLSFQVMVREAEAEAERVQLAKITTSIEPADAKWYLTRKNPDRWAETRRVDVSGRFDIGHRLDPSTLKTQEGQTALITLLRAMDSEGDAGTQPADEDGDQ